MSKPVLCIDCIAQGVASYRPAEPPGPRCATHHRERKKRTRANAHERRVQEIYGLAPGDYDRIYRFQGEMCAICRRARGVKRKLAVDHDHTTGLARGLLCSPCNKILGHLRDDPEAARRIVAYLTSPPAFRLGIRAVHKEVRSE